MPSGQEEDNDKVANSLAQLLAGTRQALMFSTFCIPSFSSLVLPLLCREMVELLDKGDSVVNHTSLSNYAFLYGVFPVAPGVAIFATQFNMEVEIVCMHCFLLSRAVSVVKSKGKL